VKNKLFIFWSFGIAIVVLIIVCLISYNLGYTKGYMEGFSKVGVGEDCVIDTDCKTPMSYLVRSNCPFESRCIENKCNVVCIGPYPNKEAELNVIAQCNKNTDCNCSTFYSGNDLTKCTCLKGLCAAIVSE